MASLPNSSPQTQPLLKLLVKGFAGFDMRLLEGVVKLSKHRSPTLELVSDPASVAVDVVMIDGRDAQALAWAEQQKSWLSRQPVVWVDYKGTLPAGHTGITRPVQWTNLPVLLSRTMDDAELSSESAAPQTSTPSKKEQAARVEPVIASAQAQNLGGAHILVVDDSSAVRGHLTSLLETWGYQVTAVDSGEAGVMAASNDNFSCVLMDVLMPGMDGYDACRRIKSMGKSHVIPPVVMLTSRASPFDKIRGKMTGCDAYLTKPVEKGRLMEVLAQQTSKSMLANATQAGVNGSGMSHV